MNKGHHPKLVARGSEAEDAGLKFKGAPADDCDPFAIQNYIDRLAAEVYDSINPPKESDRQLEDKDEWELMKEKAKNVPFHDVTLSIALKHGLLDEVKKENANKPFERDSILTIMKVRDEFLRDYADANAFEYQWQIWVEWERYLKQIGVTIPQWGKVARKLIRLGVQLIQEDMTRKYAQISSGVNKRKPQQAEEGAQAQERRRRVTLPSDTPAPFAGSPGFTTYSAPISRSSSFGGYMEAPFSSSTFSSTTSTPYSSNPSTPYSSTPSTPIYSAPSTPNTPCEAPFSPMQSPVTTSPSFRPPFENSPQAPSPFGASLYNMIHTASPTTTNIFATPMRSPSMTSTSSSQSPHSSQQLHSSQQPHSSQQLHSSQSPSGFANPNFTPSFSTNASPYPYDTQHQQGYIPSHGPMPTYTNVGVPHSPSGPSYPMPMQMQYTQMNSPSYSTPHPTYMVTSPSSAPPSLASSPNFSTLSSSPSSTFMSFPPQYQKKDDGTNMF